MIGSAIGLAGAALAAPLARAAGVADRLSEAATVLEPAVRLDLTDRLAFPTDPTGGITVLNNFRGRSVSRGPCGHQGIDIFRTDGQPGQPLLACATGVLLRKELDDGSQPQGNAIVLLGTTGDAYRYHHLAGFADGLEDGDVVVRGQLLGYMGSTGNAATYAPHLHFEVRSGGDRGTPVDPVPLLVVPPGVTVGPKTGCP